MNHAVLGEILAKESRFPGSEIFFATLVRTGQDRSEKVRKGQDRSGNVLPVLTQETKKLLAEPTQETRMKLPELAQETEKALPEQGQE